MSKYKFQLVSYIFILTIIGCAEVAPPPGGEIDRTGPFLTNSYPSNKEVNVQIGNKIELLFSEKLKEITNNKGIFISPRPIDEPEIKINSNKITITFKDDFVENQTYVIALTSDIKDLRDNSIDSNKVIAFSTGEKIDSNFISGHVYDEDFKPIPNILVGLYNVSGDSSIVNFDSIYPFYITQVDSDGKFIFQYISDKEYQLIAYDDINKDKHFNVKKERFAVSDRPMNFDSEDRLDKLTMCLSRKSIYQLDILSVNLNRDNLIRLTFSDDIDRDIYKNNPEYFSMIDLNDTSRVLYGSGTVYSEEKYDSEIIFYVPNLTDGRYRIKLIYSSDFGPFYYDEYELSLFEDNMSPSIKFVKPPETFVHPQELVPEIDFTEPIDTNVLTLESFGFWDQDGKKIDIEINWDNLLTATILPKSIEYGHQYLLKITEFEISDLSNNKLGDSLREYSFQTISNDSLGEISGEIVNKILVKSDITVILELVAISTQKKYYLSIKDGIFNMKLPSGKYLMRGFIDSNENNILDKGAVNPYRYSETSSIYPDTIRVRARFETSDIRFILE